MTFRTLFYIFLFSNMSFIISCKAPQNSKATGFTNKIQNVNSKALKIISYNIHHGNPPAEIDKIDLNEIVRILKEQKPDLIALQEIDINTERSGSIDEAKYIADHLKMNYFFGKAIDFQGGSYGVAILSKFKMSDEKVHHLPTKQSTGGEPRTLTMAVITLPSGRWFYFGSTHLDAQTSDTNRLLQIREIKRLISDRKEPFIIAGDFNDIPGSPVIDILDSFLIRTCIDCPFTIPALEPVKTIDFITYRPEKAFTVQDHQILKEPKASDHLPISASVILEPANVNE